MRLYPMSTSPAKKHFPLCHRVLSRPPLRLFQRHHRNPAQWESSILLPPRSVTRQASQHRVASNDIYLYGSHWIGKPRSRYPPCSGPPGCRRSDQWRRALLGAWNAASQLASGVWGPQCAVRLMVWPAKLLNLRADKRAAETCPPHS